jgi:predicted nucleic acid-binding protein
VADELRLLIERDEVATTDVIIAEVLHGAKTEEDFAEWSDTLEALHFFPGGQETWRTAAHISFELRTQGLITPLADLVIASVALENGLAVYAIDEHFSRVQGLRLHTPRNYSVRNQPPDSGAKE